jgi:hypothetical protein
MSLQLERKRVQTGMRLERRLVKVLISVIELSLMSRRTVSIRMADEGSGTDLGRLLSG